MEIAMNNVMKQNSALNDIINSTLSLNESTQQQNEVNYSNDVEEIDNLNQQQQQQQQQQVIQQQKQQRTQDSNSSSFLLSTALHNEMLNKSRNIAMNNKNQKTTAKTTISNSILPRTLEEYFENLSTDSFKRKHKNYLYKSPPSTVDNNNNNIITNINAINNINSINSNNNSTNNNNITNINNNINTIININKEDFSTPLLFNENDNKDRIANKANGNGINLNFNEQLPKIKNQQKKIVVGFL
jgi:hypothetical protein